MKSCDFCRLKISHKLDGGVRNGFMKRGLVLTAKAVCSKETERNEEGVLERRYGMNQCKRCWGEINQVASTRSLVMEQKQIKLERQTGVKYEYINLGNSAIPSRNAAIKSHSF